MNKAYIYVAVFLAGALFLFPLLSSGEDDVPTRSFVQQAWQAYNKGDYKKAMRIADNFISLFDVQAKQLQGALSGDIPDNLIHQYWLLNDVATVKFIKGKIFMDQGDYENAEAVFTDIYNNYTYAVTYDQGGWYWNVSKGAKDMLVKLRTGIDFGDASSSVLTQKAWEMYNQKKYDKALVYTEKCIKLYASTAITQQKSLKNYPNDDRIYEYWALNDVGTCYYISGMAHKELGDFKKSKEDFSIIKNDLLFASSWDNRGWYWKVAQQAAKELQGMLKNADLSQ